MQLYYKCLQLVGWLCPHLVHNVLKKLKLIDNISFYGILLDIPQKCLFISSRGGGRIVRYGHVCLFSESKAFKGRGYPPSSIAAFFDKKGVRLHLFRPKKEVLPPKKIFRLLRRSEFFQNVFSKFREK